MMKQKIFVPIIFIAGMVYIVRLNWHLHYTFPNQDEAHYTMVGYLWLPHLFDPNWADFLASLQRPVRFYNRYFVDPTSHFPVAYLLHGSVQHLFGPSWLVGRYTGLVFAALGLLGWLWLMVHLWGWRWTAFLVWPFVWLQVYYLLFAKAAAQPLGFAFLMWALALAYPRTNRWLFALSGVALALAVHTRIELWAMLPAYMVYLYFLRKQPASRTAVSMAWAGFVIITALLYFIAWPAPKYTWSKYIHAVLGALGISTTTTWHFSSTTSRVFTFASRWMAWSVHTRQEPLLFWGTWWLFSSFWAPKFDSEAVNQEISLYIKMIAWSTRALLALFLFFLWKGNAPYANYYVILTPLIWTLVPLILQPQHWLYNHRRLAQLWLWSGFVLWSWQVGYSLHPVLYLRGQRIFKTFADIIKPFLPPEILQRYDFPPTRVYEGFFLMLVLLVGAGVLAFIRRFIDARWKASLPWQKWPTVLLFPIIFHPFTPLSHSVEDLYETPVPVFELHAQRTQRFAQWLTIYYPEQQPTVIHQGEPTALIDLVNRFQWLVYPSTDNPSPDLWITKPTQTPASSSSYVQVLRLPAFGYQSGSTGRALGELWIWQRKP